MKREEKDGKVILTGVLMRVDERTLSGRVYPKELVEREVAKYQKLIQERRAFVTFGQEVGSVSVQLNKVAGLTTEMKVDGSDVGLEIELLDTPAGKSAQALLEHGMDFRPYGVGSVDENGVVRDYEMVGVTLVAKEK